jgi:GT2 family glycosyltransferase
MDISIICVNWNSLMYLRACIVSIYENTSNIAFEIIVVDNASPEGGIETINLLFPEVIVIKTSENVGFARANNLGFARSRGKYILLLNPDTKVIGPAINILLRAIENKADAGIVGGKLLNTDLSIHTNTIQKFPTILNQILDVEVLRLRWPSFPLWDISPLFAESEAPIAVEVIPGACMLLRRETFERVGMFSEDYFMYAEDVDLNYKVRCLGLSSYYVGAAEIVHHGGGSSSRHSRSQWATVMKYKAMLCFYKKYRGGFYGLLYRGAMASCAVGRLIFLGLSFPFGDKKDIGYTATKWSTVLKWALGIASGTV